jgi:CHRD domain
MKHSTVVSGIALSAGLIFLAAAQPLTAHDDDHDAHKKNSRINIKLNGFNENVPPAAFPGTVQALSTPAIGQFKAKINRRGGATSIDYELSYQGFAADNSPTQAHIHFGQRWQNGGISVFLCTNLGNGPAGTQACPPSPATITGTIVAADVIGPAGQGIAAGEFAEFLDALDAGATYANVHTPRFPGGEIRAQLKVQ